MRRCRPPLLAALLAGLLAGLMLLAGCGSGSGDASPDVTAMTSKQLLARGNEALHHQRYVSIQGRIGTTATRTGLELHYIGQDASFGRLTLPQGSLRFERVGSTTWLQPDAAFLRAQLGAQAAAVTRLVAGKWIVADPANQAFTELAQVASRDFVDSQVLSPEGAVHKGGVVTAGGTRCVTLKTANGTLYLDASTYLPVRVSGTGSSAVGEADFDYAHLQAPTPPPADKQVDLSKLAG